MTPERGEAGRHPADGANDDEVTLLGELLSLPPRVASRTIGQIQASQRLISMLRCSGAGRAAPDLVGTTDDDPSMSEPVDVLGVLGSDAVPTVGHADGAGQRADDPADGTAVDDAHHLDGSKDAPDVADLVIPGYDSLAASQVVPRLTTLDSAELSAIGAYEQAHRGRRTILNRVRQLLGPDTAEQ